MPARWGVTLLVFVVAACAGPSLPTPSPSQRPTPLRTSSLPPTPSLPPTLTPAPSPAIEHDTGSRDLILRLDVPYHPLLAPRSVEWPPQISLYGDGQLVYALGNPDPETNFDLRQARIPEQVVDDLLSYALGPGGLATARDRYDDVEIFDLDWTVFEIHAVGVDKQVWVYSLGNFDDDVPSAPERARFQSLAGRIRGTVADAEAGEFGAPMPYLPEAYLATVSVARADMQPNTDWPWPDLEPADVVPYSVITTAQGEAVVSLGIQEQLVVTGPDGHLYVIQVRPLLPDELSE